MTQALEAAVRAAARQFGVPWDDVQESERAEWRDAVLAAFAAALPEEPTPEMREVLIGGLYEWQDRDMFGDADRAYRALRAELLG